VDYDPNGCERHMRPLVEQTVALFGDPIAVVRDLGGGVTRAVAHLRQRGIRDFACHYHFLRAVGTALFDDAYSALRGHLKRHKVATELNSISRRLKRYGADKDVKGPFGIGTARENLTTLIHWLVHGDGSKDLPYPFSLPELERFRRCCQAKERIEQWVPKPRSVPEFTAILKIGLLLSRVIAAGRPSAIAAEQLDARWRAFCELRDVMKLTAAELPGGDLRLRQGELPALQAQRQTTIEKATHDYLEDLRKRVERYTGIKPSQTAEGIILGAFERHGAYLFGHPARFDASGAITAVVDRTDNILEHFFGSQNQRLRRRLGRAHLGRDLEDQPAQAALAANLRHPDYVRVLCGALDRLPFAFASLDRHALQQVTPLTRSNRDTAKQARVRLLLESLNEDRDIRPARACAGSAATVV
jgi:hypothetical protein